MDTGEDIQFFVIGPLRAERNSVELDLGGVKQRTLLAQLLLSPNLVVHVDRLIDTLWGEQATDRALGTLHVYMAKLRKALGDEAARDGVIETVRPGYRIRVSEDTLDLLRFQALTKQASTMRLKGDHPQAAGLLTEALAEVRGPLLVDLADEDFVRLESQIFDGLCLTANLDLLECELESGHHREATGELQRLFSLHPYHEHLGGLLMVALYRSGRQAEALNVYKELRDTLSEELGVDPSPQIQDLELKILNHDRTLAVVDPMISRSQEGTITVTRSSRPALAAELLYGPDRVKLDRAVTTLGRFGDQMIVIHDPDASRRHAEIRRTPRGFLLVDVGSRNGTYVNGVLVAEQLLEDGDEIQIGDAVLVLHVF